MTKDHILCEIRRTASENGGKPLGRERFFAATGIKAADWEGKYWIRWNDAVKEAGFQPNKLNTAIADDDLLGRLAALVKELGHFPVIAELRFKAHTDPEFPSKNTFRRLGGMRELAARLEAHCLSRGERDLAALCTAAMEPIDESDPEPVNGEQLYGFVYLIKSGRFFKVGRSNAVGRRERELAIQLPEKTKLLHSIRTDDPIGIEAYWHKRFGGKRKNGEWFELAASDVAAFRRRKFM